MTRRLEAVLFDMDGTIVDTEPAWMAAEHRLATAHGAQWTTADGEMLIGNSLPVAGDYIKQRMGLDLTSGEIVDHLLTEVGAVVRGSEVPWRPGALDLLVACNDAGLPTALVTMSYRSLADVIVDVLPAGRFDAIVSGDEVTHGKPHPEPYLRAAELLGADPRGCVAVEDSPAGAASAEAAGCFVVVVPHLVDVPMTARRATFSSLVGASPATLGQASELASGPASG